MIAIDKPILAYRFWDVVANKEGIRLRLGWNGKKMERTWPVGEATVACCEDGHKHLSPADLCDCGLYAYSATPVKSHHYGVYGQVYLWGKFIRHTKGWRAQYAYPAKFLSIPCSECGKQVSPNQARTWLSIAGEKNHGYAELHFICVDCLPDTCFPQLFLPAAYIVEQLELAYQLDRIPQMEVITR